MSQDPLVDISEFRTDRLLRVAIDAPEHPTVRLISLAYVVAGLCHLWLADAWIAEWIPGNIAFILGLSLLLWRPCSLGFLLCALGKLLPLLFARDHLTQSVFLLLIAFGGAYFLGVRAYLATWPGRLTKVTSSMGTTSPQVIGFLTLVQGVTIVTYGAAAFHKLNRDFFDPAYSCALYGLDKVFAHYDLLVPGFVGEFALGLAVLVVVAEASIALLYLAGRRRLALVIALLFHLPLTLTVAPAFAFVMLVGHAAFFRPVDLANWRDVLTRRWPVLVGGATLITVASLVRGGLPFNDWTMAPREWALWLLLLTALLVGPSSPKPKQAPIDGSARGDRLVAIAVVLLFALHCLSPYLGARFHHTAAMVSNLRIDQGCWNHLIVSESLRIEDPYIRVDEVYFVRPGAMERYEAMARDQLWNGTMIHQMQKNWCRESLRPFYLAGTYRGRTFEINDLCDEELDWPFADDGLLGREIFKDHLLFQRNLPRQCPQTCIH